MNAYAQSADAYLVQRVMGAGPELQAALLMEAGQRFLGKAVKALKQNDHFEVARCLRRVTEIINEAICRLNYDEESELVDGLLKVYDWWTVEILEASSTKDAPRLEAVSGHMGEIREAWEQLNEKNYKALQTAEFQVGDQVV